MKVSTIIAGLAATSFVVARPEPAKGSPSRGGGKNGVTGKSGYVPAVSRNDLDKAWVQDWNFRVDCDPENLKKWETAWLQPIEEGTNYLGNIPGDRRPTRPAWTCERVSCSYSAGIFWCNETGEQKSLRTYSDIAVGARKIIDECIHRNELGMPIAKGAAYHGTGWKVEIRTDEANC